MKANIEKIKGSNTVTTNRKDNHFTQQYTVFALDMTSSIKGPRELIILRLYSTGAANYACIWVHGIEINGHGGGRAGVGGYHSPSAAANMAINSAGITLSSSIDGRGDGAILEALAAIAEAVGSREYFIADVHA